MTGELRGPWKTLPGADGTSVPFYVIPFDKAGVCTGPRSLDHLVTAAADATDVFCFSHGWNNDWAAATSRYDRFAERYAEARRAHWSPPTREYRPILVGVFWPSTALVSEEAEGPDIAAAATSTAAPDELAELNAVADAFGGEPPARLYDLAQRDTLSRGEIDELATLLAPVLGGDDDEFGDEKQQVSPDELVEVWSRIRAAEEPADGRTADQPGGFIDDAPPVAGDPTTAGVFDFLKPREIIRTATVLLMKDRAGKVGGNGVADMLRRLLAASDDSRIHLIGHSYGAKVVLSALCSGAAPSRKVDSVLLLQPATSALCFARDAGQGRPGGYRSALERSAQPVVTTFSRHDAPLTKLFHWAARRSSDLGEAVIAGGPPSKYAALGGFGPQGVSGESRTITPAAAPHTYDLSPAAGRIVAIRADDVISNHGAVQNPATAWALLCQVMR